jgi:hypothetical protein
MKLNTPIRIGIRPTCSATKCGLMEGTGGALRLIQLMEWLGLKRPVTRRSFEAAGAGDSLGSKA